MLPYFLTRFFLKRRALMSTTSDRLGEQAKVVTKDLQEMGDIARDAAREKLGELRENASGCYQRGHDKVQGVVSAVEQTIVKQPLKSVLIAVGVGLVLGRLWAWMGR
jgi:ElaB/YqjD/DUF883 family membrane-anchored ribosome-binding protein